MIPLGPTAITAIAGAALLGVSQWQLHQAESALEAETVARQVCVTSLTLSTANVEALTAGIDFQNDQIADLARQAQAADRTAQHQALDTLTRIRARNTPSGHGPAALNQWMEDNLQ